MSDELPETDDPFELLGVDRQASERQLKSAYVRLIKRFRPERAPEEFKRIREAYEAAQRRTTSLSVLFETADHAAASSTDQDELAERDAQPWSEAPVLATDDSHDDYGLAEEILEAARRDELARIQELLGDTDTQSAARRSQTVMAACHMALAAVYWRAPEWAEVIATGLGDNHDYFSTGLLDDARDYWPAFERTRKKAPCPPAVERFLRLAPLLAPEEVRVAAGQIVAEASAAPGEFLRFFLIAQHEAPELLYYYTQCLRSPSFMTELDFEHHPETTRHQVIEQLAQLQERLDHTLSIRRTWISLSGMALLGLIGTVMELYSTWWYWVLGVLALIATNGVDGLREYRRSVQPALLHLALYHGVTPVAFSRYLKANPKAHDELRAFDDEMAEDSALQVAAATFGAAIDPALLAERYGDAVFVPHDNFLYDDDDDDDRHA